MPAIPASSAADGSGTCSMRTALSSVRVLLASVVETEMLMLPLASGITDNHCATTPLVLLESTSKVCVPVLALVPVTSEKFPSVEEVVPDNAANVATL